MNKIYLYGAEWCKPCRDVKALLDELNLDYYFTDVDHSDSEIIQNITKIPYMMIRNGNEKVIATHVGAISKRHLLKLVQEDGEG